MMRRLHRLCRSAALLAAVLSLLAGCGFKDIDKRFFVVAMGIDLPEGEDAKGYKVTLKLAIASPKAEPGASKTQMETVQASTIAEAVRLLKSHVDKEIDFGHCKLFLFGEKLAKGNISKPLDWLARRRDIQSVAFLAVGKPDAETVLQAEPKSERYPGNALFLTFGKDGSESSYTISEYVFDFMRRIEEKGMDPILPVMTTEKQEYVTTRLALLDKSKIVTTLTASETETFNQIDNDFHKTAVTADVGGDTLVIETNSVSSHYRIVKQGDSYVLKMKIKVSGIFEEAPIGIYDQNWNKLEQQFNKQLEAEATALLKKMQKAGVDPMGFGLRFRATHAGSPKTWQAWQRIYPKLTFDVKANVVIEGTGITK